MNSDSESNVSGFINYNDKNCKKLYISMIQQMDIINQDLQEVECNLRNVVKDSGALENKLGVLLQSFPKPMLHMPFVSANQEKE